MSILLESIYEIEGTWLNNGSNIRHSNTISSKPEQSVDESAEKNLSIFLEGNHSLSYSDTLYYPIGEEVVHRYYFVDNQEACVLMKEDSSIMAILGTIAIVDVENTASSEEVRTLVEPLIGQWITPSNYNHTEVSRSLPEEYGRFGMYTFLYSNVINGYITSWAKISVTDAGRVFAFWKRGVDVPASQLNIDKELEKQLIELKLGDMYNTELTSLIAYELMLDVPSVNKFNGELCIKYNICVTYIDKSNNGERTIGDQIEILIPIRLMQMKG
jgi:hypothetical protein